MQSFLMWLVAVWLLAQATLAEPIPDFDIFDNCPEIENPSEDMRRHLMTGLQKALQDPTCFEYIFEVGMANDNRDIGMCPSKRISDTCSDLIGQALLSAFPKCDIGKTDEECHVISNFLVDSTFYAAQKEMPDGMGALTFCKYDDEGAVERSFKHGVEAWCRGATDIKSVTFSDGPSAFDQTNSSQDPTDNQSTNAQKQPAKKRGMSAAAVLGITVLVVVLVGALGVGFMTWRARRGGVTSGWDMATVLQGGDYSRLDETIGGNSSFQSYGEYRSLPAGAGDAQP